MNDETDLSALVGAEGVVSTSLPDTTAEVLPEQSEQDAAQPYIGMRSPYRPRPAPVVPQVTDEASYNTVPMGGEYLDPSGTKRTKPYRVAALADYEKVPEGRVYLDPQGIERTKPKFEPVSFTTQTLYDMALTPKEKRKIMEREFGRTRVHEDARGLYAIDEDGKYRKPGYGWTAAGGAATAMAAPVALSTAGALAGGGLGLLTGPGAPAASPLLGAGGAVGGGIAGQAFNDFVLLLAGVKDRTPMEEAGNLGTAGLMNLAGFGVGRGLATFAPTIKEGLSAATTAAPAFVRNLLGATPETMQLSKQILDKGGAVPPSAAFPGAPHLQNVVERFGPAMDTSNPLKKNVEGYYEREAGNVLRGGEQRLRDIGVPEDQIPRVTGTLLEPGASPNLQQTGTALMARAGTELADADSALQGLVAARRAVIEVEGEARVAERNAIATRAVEARTAAQRMINAGYDDISRTADDAMRVAQAGHNSGELWDAVGARLRAVKQGVNERARVMYQTADDLVPPGVVPETRGLINTAREVLAGLPEDFQRAYPNVVHQLRRLGGEFDEAGQMVRPPIQPTFGELHHIRTVLRSNADWNTLESDFRNGTFKHFAQQADNALHDVRSVPALRPAVEALDLADNFYRENIRIFNAKQIETIMKGLRAGEPADPNVLYNAIIKEGHTDLINRIREMVGPQLWRGVQGADLNQILRHSADLAPNTIDGSKFVREILDRHRQGTLAVVHGPQQAQQLLRQAEAVRAMTDKRVLVQTRPGDTVAEVIMRVRQTADEAATAAQRDPLAVLQREMRQVANEGRKDAAALRQRKDDPLGFLYDPTMGAAKAAERILSSEDLMLATAKRFGADSKEFEMLRQVYAQRLLQGDLRPADRLAKVSEEMQQLMFPGVTRAQMQTLADEMRFLTDTKLFQQGDFGGALSATAKVEHPIAGRLVSGAMKMLPGANMAARSALGAYYDFARRMSTENPAVFNFLMRGLAGTPEEKTKVREILVRHSQRYGAMGAAGAQGAYQAPREDRPRTVH